MKPKVISIIDFLKKNKKLWIPLYQRNYNWREKQFDDLFYDIENCLETKKSHFFGPIICLKKNGSYEIIDGQQRLTTIIVLLLTIYKKASDTDEDELKEQLSKLLFLPNGDLKLKLHKRDNEDFVNLKLHLNSARVENMSIRACWDYFNSKTIDEKNLKEYFEALFLLEIVVIEAGENEDSQIIFDRINTTGLALSNYDKIKNSIYLMYSNEEQKKIDDYFVSIEISLNARSNPIKIDSFLKDFFISKFKTNLRGNVYSNYREKLMAYNNDQTIVFVKELTQYAYLYGKFTNDNPKIEESKVNNEINELLDFNQALPYKIQKILFHFRTFQFKAISSYVIFELYNFFYLGKVEAEVFKNIYRAFFDCLKILTNNPSNLDYSSLRLYYITGNINHFPKSAVRANLDDEFGTRRKLLFLKYFIAYRDVGLNYDDIERAGVNDPIYLNGNTKAILENILSSELDENSFVPNPMGTKICLNSPNDFYNATGKKPYRAIINQAEIDEISSWKQLKIEAIKKCLVSNQQLFQRLKSFKHLTKNRYVYVSLNREILGEEFSEEIILGKKVYINERAQSSNQILNIIYDCCNRNDSYVECI